MGWDRIQGFTKNAVLWLSERFTLVFSIVGIFYVALTTWSSLPHFTIFNWRPSEALFFGSILIFYILTLASGFINDYAKKHNNSISINEIKNNFENKIKFYQDQLFQGWQEALNEHLQEIATHLDFDTQERICVYIYNNRESCFNCIGRYSKHYEYNQLSIRKKYNEGIIGHVWNDSSLQGFKQDSDIPDSNTEEYYEYLKAKYNITKAVSRKFRMNPVDIIAEVIRDNKDKPVAVIIFESQRREFLVKDKINQYYTNFKKGLIVSVLEKLQTQHTPDIKTAMEAAL